MSQTQDRPQTAKPAAGGRGLTLIQQPASPAAESYRSLRSTVKFANVNPPVRSLLVVDAGTDGQHSATAANLAVALALAGDKVILVDANLRQPRLHEFFGGTNARGLSDWLDSSSLEEPFLPLEETGIQHLRLLAAGRTRAAGLVNGADRLSDDACTRLLNRLRDEADFIVIDAPPVPEYGDALALAAQVDGVLLLVRSGRTKRGAAQRAKELLDRVGARILGVVLTDAKRIAG